MASNTLCKQTDRTVEQLAKNVNYTFFVAYIKSLPNYQNLKVLDYGCGRGIVVQLLRKEGVECYGVEAFYEGSQLQEVRESPLFREGIIREIPSSGEIPFPEHFFDVIISNQVFEHVEDLPSVLAHLSRVLKPEGVMHHHFPSLEVIREGHIGIPLAHRLPKGRLRFLYTVALRSLGLGYYKHGKPIAQWTREALEWIDRFCYYRPYRSLYHLFTQEYEMTHHEIDYCRYRARNHPLLHFLLRIEPLRGVYERLFRLLAFMVIELRKQPEPQRG
jgi:SAM-dependent methyltransferase